MKRASAPWLLLAAAVLFSACAQEDTSAIDKVEATDAAEQVAGAKKAVLKEVEQATDQIEADFIAAFNAEDGAGIAALFAPDGMIAPPELVSIEQPAIAMYYDAQFESGADFTLEVEREGILVTGDMSVAWGGFATSVIAEGAETIVTTGRYGVVSKRMEDGTWKIYRHLFNYITPPPEM